MKKWIIWLMGLTLILISGPSMGMDQGCNPKKYKTSETHHLGAVRCKLDLTMSLNSVCNAHATSFKAIFSGNNLNNITMTCTETKSLTGVIGVYTGHQYKCKWTANGKPREKDFNWMRFGAGSQTCSILKDWVEISVQ